MTFSLLVTFSYFFTARNFYKLFFTAETRVRFVTFYYFFYWVVTFINYFLLLIEARGIVVLYLFIVQGEGGGS